MKKLWVVVLLISLGVNLGLLWRLSHRRTAEVPAAAPAPGQHMDFDGHPDPDDHASWDRLTERRLGRLAERLDLSSEQQQQMSDLHREAAGELRSRRGMMTVAKQRMHELMEREQVPADSLRLAMAEMAAVRTGLDSLVTEFMLRELEVLDDQQRRLYLEMLPLGRGSGAGPGSSPWGRGHGRGKDRNGR